MEPHLSRLVVPHTSPLSDVAGDTVFVPSRSKEVLKCSSRDLSTHLHRLVLTKGIRPAEAWLKQECDALPPPPERERVGEGVLEQNIRTFIMKTPHASVQQIIRHLRDEQGIAASAERIRETTFRLRQQRLPLD